MSDRAVLRALHFFADDMRVQQQVQALEDGTFDQFLRLVRESGRSSWTLLQNCYSIRSVGEQGVPLALALSAILLGGDGAWSVHGGGFAGTILAFVPDGKLDGYLAGMRAVFGPDSCHPLSIRAAGAVMLDTVAPPSPRCIFVPMTESARAGDRQLPHPHASLRRPRGAARVRRGRAAGRE